MTGGFRDAQTNKPRRLFGFRDHRRNISVVSDRSAERGYALKQFLGGGHEAVVWITLQGGLDHFIGQRHATGRSKT